MASLGQDLRREREARGIPLEKIAAATKIGLRYLEALEADRHDLLPGAFFTKGIVRTYAAFIGLEEEAVVAKYAAAGIIAPPRSPAVIPPDGKTDAAAPRVRIVARAAAAVAALAVVSIAAYLLLRPRSGGSAAASADPTATPPSIAPTDLEAAVPTPPGSTAAIPDGDPAVTAAAGADRGTAPATESSERLTLEISFVDLTWLQIFADGRQVVDGIKSPGESVRVEAELEILLHTGNAGGMTLRLDGRAARPLGRAGQVVKNVRITRRTAPGFLAEETGNTP